MSIGIIGRSTALLAKALATAHELGHAAIGTTSDAEALGWVFEGQVSVLVVGGGVEASSRQSLASAGDAVGVKIVEVFGPENLRAALATLK